MQNDLHRRVGRLAVCSSAFFAAILVCSMDFGGLLASQQDSDPSPPLLTKATSEKAAGKTVATKVLNARTKNFNEKLLRVLRLQKSFGPLTDLTDFEWNIACSVNPYGTWVEKTVPGVTFDAYKNIPWIDDDTAWTLLLVHGTELTPIRVERSTIDYRHAFETPACIESYAASFTIEKNGSQIVIKGTPTK